MTRESVHFPDNLPDSVAWAVQKRWPAVSEKTQVIQTEAEAVHIPICEPLSVKLRAEWTRLLPVPAPPVPAPGFRAAAWRFLGHSFHRYDWYKRGIKFDFVTMSALANTTPSFGVERIPLFEMRTKDGLIMRFGYGPRSDVLAVRKKGQ